jgi:O-antigen/teichoic acid export membrane protein
MSEAGAAPPRKPQGDTISRNAAFAFAAQLSTAAFTAALIVILTRVLGPAEFGTFALALSITGLVQRASSGSTSQAVARYLAERHEKQGEVVAVLGMALRIRLLSAAGLGLGLFLLAGPIAALYNEPDLFWPVRGVAIALFGQSMVGFATSVFTALRRTTRSFILVVSESAMEFTASVALVLLGGGAAGAAFGRAIGYLFGTLLAMFLLGRLLGRSPLFSTGRSPVERRDFVRYAGAMLIVSSASAIYAQLDVLLLGAFMSAAAVGIYTAPLRLVAFLGYPGLAVAQGVAPRLARHPEQKPSLAALVRAIRYMLLLQAGMSAALLVWAEPIVRLILGDQFLASAEVMRALTPVIFLNGIGPLLISPLNYAGEGRRRIPVAIAAVIIAAVLDTVLIQAIGTVGAAIGTDIAFAFYLGGHLWLARSVLGLPLGPLGRGALGALVAATAMGGVLAAFGTVTLSAVDWIAGLVAASCVYVGVALLVRVIAVDELQALARLPRKALHPG